MPGPDSPDKAPLVEALTLLADRSYAPFHTPGHKKGRGASDRLRALMGTSGLRADLPELPELDNLFAPEGVLQEAQALAAMTFGAEQTWFLANGSTCGLEAAVLATCRPGEAIILPRNVHRSVISALVLADARPIWVDPDYDSRWDIAHCPSPTAIATALTHHPEAKAVLIVSPTYYGVGGDLQTIAQITHQSSIPLLVDEAHGAHFAFHPALPPPALSAGADLVVQSTHKTLGALTQAAMLHVQGARIDRDRLNASLQLVQSTSPNYLLLASLDAARQQMATQGKVLMQQTLELATYARSQLQRLGLPLLASEEAGKRDGFKTLDRTRLTLDVAALGWSGFEADDILHQELGVTAELPSLRQLTFIITLGNTLEDIDRLIQACRVLVDRRSEASLLEFPLPPAAQSQLPPRQAFFSPSHPLTIDQAINQVSAELICPYPPGIPVVLPGEVITAEAIEYLQQVLKAGGILTGCTDPTLSTLSVIRAQSTGSD